MGPLGRTAVALGFLTIAASGIAIAGGFLDGSRPTETLALASTPLPPPRGDHPLQGPQLAHAAVETDANVLRCDELAAGYAFRDALDKRGLKVVAIEDIDFTSALTSCGAALDAYPNHLRSKFHYARATEAASYTSFYPHEQDSALATQSIDLYQQLCTENIALACHNVAAQKLRLGMFSEAKAILDPACKMDQSQGAGASCALLGTMFEKGQTGQKKTLAGPMFYIPSVAALTIQQPAYLVGSLP